MNKTPAILLTILALTTGLAFAHTTSVEQRANLLNQIKDDPTNTELHYQLGALELFTFADPDAAAFHYATASTTGARYDTLHNEAVAHAQAGRYAQAIELLQNALQQNPSPKNKATTLELLGDVLHTAQDYEAAASVYQELFELTNEPHAQYKHLRARYANGETTTLSVPLQELRDHAKPHASELLALIYQTTGMISYATHELELTRQEAIDTADLQTLARVSIQLAQNHYATEDYEAATRAITDVHLITTDQAASYTEGIIHLANGDPGLAYEAFTRGQNDTDLTPERRFGAVIAATSTLDTRNATRHMRAALTITDREDLGLTQLSRTATIAAIESLYRAGDATTAESLARNLNMSDYTPDELTIIGTIAYENNNYADATRAFTALEEHPAADSTQRLAALRNQAHALQANKQYAAAAALYDEYLNAAPYDTQVLYHHGWALLHTNNATEAARAWREAQARGYDPASTAMKHLPD